jgi:hypothetical protein
MCGVHNNSYRMGVLNHEEQVHQTGIQQDYSLLGWDYVV